MKIKNLALLIAAAVFVFAIAGCSVEIQNPEEPTPDNIQESAEPSEPKEPKSEPEETPFESDAPEESEQRKFMSFEEITAQGYYPLWMQPHSYIVYNENGIPEITEGGALAEEDVERREDIEVIGYIDSTNDDIFKIQPNTKAEYDLHGFMQNIYYLWPDGNYNLSPPLHEIYVTEITYYEDIANFSQETGVTVSIKNLQFDVFRLASKMNVGAESTSEPMDFPRYKINFFFGDEAHSINIDSRNIFSSTMLEGGNYISSFGNDYFSEAEELFNKAQ